MYIVEFVERVWTKTWPSRCTVPDSKNRFGYVSFTGAAKCPARTPHSACRGASPPTALAECTLSTIRAACAHSSVHVAADAKLSFILYKLSTAFVFHDWLAAQGKAGGSAGADATCAGPTDGFPNTYFPQRRPLVRLVRQSSSVQQVYDLTPSR